MGEKANINNLGLLNSLSEIINAGNQDSNYAIATYIIHNMNRIQDLSINDIVDESYSSRSAVRRFAERLGYENYSAMKASIGGLIFPSDLRHRNLQTLKNHRAQLDELIESVIVDINELWPNEVLEQFVSLLHSYDHVLLICANNTSGDLIRFQQELVYANKVVSVISGRYTNNRLAEQAEPGGLIITVSASGKFAEIANEWIKTLPGHKILITGNRSEVFKQAYDQRFFISSHSFTEDHLGVYGKYGITYLLDLISTSYLFRFAN